MATPLETRLHDAETTLSAALDHVRPEDLLQDAILGALNALTAAQSLAVAAELARQQLFSNRTLSNDPPNCRAHRVLIAKDLLFAALDIELPAL